MSSHSLHFIGFSTYCLRNLAGAEHRNKHGKVRKLPEFSSCWCLVIYSFQRRKWKIRGFLIENVAPLPKPLLHKYKQFSGSTKIYFPFLPPWQIQILKAINTQFVFLRAITKGCLDLQIPSQTRKYLAWTCVHSAVKMGTTHVDSREIGINKILLCHNSEKYTKMLWFDVTAVKFGVIRMFKKHRNQQTAKTSLKSQWYYFLLKGWDNN